jgi:hypothetical protein
MATFETLPSFELDWERLTPEQQASFRQVVLDAFEPDLAVPDHLFRPSLRVREITGHPGVFEMRWGDYGWATFSYGAEHEHGQPHVIWREIGSLTNSSC